MADLSHWDFAERFTGQEVAALVIGYEPSIVQEEDGIAVMARPISQRLREDYERAHAGFFFQLEGLDNDQLEGQDIQGMPADLINPPGAVVSIEMMQLARRCFDSFEEVPFSNWLQVRASSFELQYFSRRTITDWLRQINRQSAYVFEIDRPARNESLPKAWPWGNHHTENLGHLAAAAKKWWVNYEPSDPSTAPTNETVVEWLKTDRNVSGKMAEAIASMLRLDGLRTGPRK